MSGVKLQAIAIKFNEKLKGEHNFTASVGWLSRCKNRHGIHELGVDFKTKFEKFVSDEDLMPCKIFNTDETGLNYTIL